MRKLIPVLLIIVVFMLIPTLPMPTFWITLLNYIGLYAIVAMGLVLLTGVGGLTSFGQAAFVGIGAYTTAYLSITLGWSPWLGLIIGLLITAASAYLIGTITMRMAGHFLPLATIAWGLSIYLLFGTVDFLGKYDGLLGLPAISLLSIELRQSREVYYLIWLLVFLAYLSLSNLLHSRPGRAIRALRENAEMAESMGANTAKLKIIIFVYAAVLASVSGWLFAHMQRAVNPSPFSLISGIEYLFMAVLGGIGHLWGAILGAAAFVISKEIIQSTVPMLGLNANIDLVVFGIMIVLVLMFVPQGLWSLFRRVLPETQPLKVNFSESTLKHREHLHNGSYVLEVEQITKKFGGLTAVNAVSFKVGAGEIVGLIGPNGAGKSTSFNLITGLLNTTDGNIRLHGQDITGLKSRQIAALGVGRTFQHVQLVNDMSVLENVALGAYLRTGHGSDRGILSSVLKMNQQEENQHLAEAARHIERVGLSADMHKPAGSLPLGQQRIVEIARALCLDPSLLLLDEPAAGLRYKEKQVLAELLKELKASGVSLLLVEHDMDFVMNLTDRLVVMEFGTLIAEGYPHDISQNPKVLAAYLGGTEL